MRWIYAEYTKVGGATSRWGRENFLGPLLVLPRPMIIENQQFREPWPKKGSEDSSMAAEGDDDGCELWAHDQRGSRSGSQTLSPWAFAEGLADHHLEGDSVISLTCAFLSGRNKGTMFSKGGISPMPGVNCKRRCITWLFLSTAECPSKFSVIRLDLDSSLCLDHMFLFSFPRFPCSCPVAGLCGTYADTHLRKTPMFGEISTP